MIIPMTDDERRLTEEYLYLVPEMVKKLTSRCAYVSYDEQQDLLQAGNLALCKAAMNYDNTRPFAVYAKVAIRNAIYSYWRKLQKERKYTCSMYASSEFDMEPLLVDQKTELWQEQCMNQEPIYKHLQSLEARSCNTLRKGIHIIMKLSRYNIEKKEDKSCLIYNTVTSAILELDTDYEKSYYEMKEGKKCSKPDLESALLEGGMLVEDDKDEFAELLIRNKIERFADSNLTLTIAPTMACNFCCPYCYEKGREYITMSETVQDQLTSQLKEKYQHIHELTVSWYGGEPLLAIETIEKLTKKIKSVLPLGCKYNADMVTNGYKLTRRVAEKLKDMDIHYIQVTLDGSKQAHDSRRILHNHQPTFKHILDNIRECADILNISIRINVDKTNINEATEIFDWLERYGLKGRVGYYLAPVDDINGV